MRLRPAPDPRHAIKLPFRALFARALTKAGALSSRFVLRTIQVTRQDLEGT